MPSRSYFDFCCFSRNINLNKDKRCDHNSNDQYPPILYSCTKHNLPEPYHSKYNFNNQVNFKTNEWDIKEQSITILNNS